MSQDIYSFPWPALPGSQETPRWLGDGFEYRGKRCKVLCYAENESNWSDELTELHELEAGGDHPMDIASRALAISSIERYCEGPSPLLLEVGSSSGYLLEEIRSLFPEARVIGSDYIAGPLEKLASRVPSIPLLQFDLRTCPLPSNTFDGVILLNVLEHIDDDVAAIRQIARILKPRGIAHIEVPSNPDCYDIYDEHLLHHRRYRAADLVRTLRQEGFEILKATHLGVFLYPVFWLVKKRNRRLLKLPKERKEQIVAGQIRRTRQSRLLSLCMRMELFIGGKISYPCGIRCILVVRKKA